MLNSAQAKELFNGEAILFGDTDGVPLCRAIELFGEKAVNWANDLTKGWTNGFGIGGYTVLYLNFSGFKQAATYANVEEIRKNQKKEGNLIIMNKPKVNEKRKNNHETKTENDMGLS